MSRSQEAVQSLLNNIPLGLFSSDEHRTTFENIKNQLAASSDFDGDLKKLYTVKDFSNFALSLLWVAKQVEENPIFLEATTEDEQRIFTSFCAAVGEDVGFPASPAEPPLESFMATSAEATVPPPVVSEASGDEKGFAQLLEKFVEVMQSGDDARMSLLQQVLGECAVVVSGAGFAEDYKEYCRLMTEFLNYINENQLMDDVRVMNILSNVSSPVSQWANAAPEARSGLLEEGIGPLRDFKSMFE
ncbi:MAG: hypothetical protein HY088_08215 [Ignavibacteriales bacterium]|nr:hypothetical protein [Ignavibacteriales bacterium]